MPQPMPQSKACTLEAKICPDGSSVGRTGPNCEFAACPSVFIRLDKISPGLQERLEKSQADERIKVAIWVKEKPRSTGPSRPSPDEKEMTQKEIDDFLAEVDKENARIVEETIRPVVAKLGNMGIFEVETNSGAPIIFASLTPEVIKTISVWEEILSVDEGDLQVQQE